jgi:hypothetical protein
VYLQLEVARGGAVADVDRGEELRELLPRHPEGAIVDCGVRGEGERVEGGGWQVEVGGAAAYRPAASARA